MTSLNDCNLSMFNRITSGSDLPFAGGIDTGFGGGAFNIASDRLKNEIKAGACSGSIIEESKWPQKRCGTTEPN